MVKINISRVKGLNTKVTRTHHKSILPQFFVSSVSSRISRVSSKTIWSFFASAVFVQCLVSWRIFYPPKPSYISGPPYNITETVALLTEWYEVLQDMTYLGKDSISYPPHVDDNGESTINVTLARQFGLHERVIETMLQMPYVNVGDNIVAADEHKGDKSWWPGWMKNRGVLWRNGHFVNYRSDADIWLALDPLMRADHSFGPEDVARMTLEERIIDLEAVPKSTIPLSFIRNPTYGLVLLLDVETNRILVLDTQGGSGNSDPFFDRWDTLDKTPYEYKIPGRFYGVEGVYARSAAEILREFITKTVNLEPGFVPGSVRTDEHYTPELSPPRWEQWVRELYYQCGWPSAEVLGDCHYPNRILASQDMTCIHDPLDSFSPSIFSEKMADLRHDITVRYRQDWYCPVPRNPEVVARLQNSLHGLTEEQVAYALGDEPVIPLDLNGWGGHLIWQLGWKEPE